MPGKIEKVSVLMPVYNSEKYIRQSVKSILNQCFGNFEFIIIDDGSTDNTGKIINEFKDSRIIYKKTEHNGTSAALNYGVKLCTYGWIARIDSDDLNTKTRLEEEIKFLESNPGCDILSCFSVYFKDPLKVLFLLSQPVSHEEIYDFLDLHNPMNQSGLMIRKSILEENPFNEDFRSSEDFELLYRIRDRYRFANLPEYLVYTRLRDDSRSAPGDNEDIYNMLFNPSFKKMIDAKSKGEHFYRASTIAWLNYFYGSRKDSRGYLKNSFSWKNLAAYFSTFLPDEYFNKFIKLRLKYRLKNLFKSSRQFKKELKELNS